MGWGSGIGGFVQGYQDTLMKRHAQKQQDFTNTMSIAQHRLAAATELRNRPIQDANTETLAKEYEDTAHQEMMDAEKKLNEKIGGLAKLGSMFKGLMGKGKDAGSSGQDSGQAASDQTSSSPPPAPMPQTAELSGPPPAPDSGNAPPEFQQGSAGMYQQSVTPPQPVQAQPGLPPPPSAQPAASASNQIDPNTGLRADQHWNQEITAKNWLEQKKERDRLDLQSKKAQSDAAALHTQKQKELDDDWAKISETPGFKAMTPAAQSRAEVAFRLGSKDIFDKTATKTHFSNNPIKGEDGNYYLETQVFNEDSGEWEPGKRVLTGPPAGVTTAETKLSEEKKNYIAANPGATPEQAETAVRAAKQRVKDMAAQIKNVRLLNDKELLAYHGDRTKFYREAQEAKSAGRERLTPAQAISLRNHSDAMAQSNIAKDLQQRPRPMSKEELLIATERLSDQWLQDNAGMSRDDLIQAVNRKTPAAGAKATPSSAVDSLAKPPSSKAKPAKSAGEKKPVMP